MKALISTILIFWAVVSTNAQEKLTRYFPAGETNAEILIDKFLTPLGKDISVLPNNGWYTTAKTHKKWGFDLSVTVNSVFTSNEKKFYDFPANMVSGLTYLGTDAGSSKVPTAYGVEGENPQFEITSGSNSGIQFRGADGFEPGKEFIFEAQHIYTLQGGLGLFKNTDLRFRLTPKTKISSVEFGNWGVGVMHDLLQHFVDGGENKFSLSVFLGYTVINGTVDLSSSGYVGNGQETKVTTSGFTGQAVGSFEVSILTFYGALGYDTGKTDIDVNGTYNVDSYIDLNGDPAALAQSFALTNPFSYSYDNNGLRFTLGMRFKLGPVTLNGDYSFVGDNRVLALGIGFTVK